MADIFCHASDETGLCVELGFRRYDHHACIYGPGHDGAHECGCGHRWTENH